MESINAVDVIVGLNKEIADLKAKNASLEDSLNAFHATRSPIDPVWVEKKYKAELTTITEDRDRRLNNLQKYGDHLPACQTSWDEELSDNCTCGLRQALKESNIHDKGAKDWWAKFVALMKQVNWGLIAAFVIGLMFWACVIIAFTGCAQYEYKQTPTETHIKWNSLMKDIKIGDIESESNKLKAIGAGGWVETKEGE